VHHRFVVAALAVVALLFAACSVSSAPAMTSAAGDEASPPPVAEPGPPRSATAGAPDPERRAAEPARGQTVTVALTGDVHAERQIARTLAAGGNPFDAVVPIFLRADLTVVNLETAVGVAGDDERAEKAYTFLAPPSLWGALASAGVDVVSLANNHSLDFGVDLLAPMIADATRHGLRHVGAGADADEAYAPAIFEIGGRRIAVLGLTRVIPRVSWAAGSTRPGLASAYDDRVAVNAVTRAAEQADHVVVTIHWGQEGSDCIDEHQKRLGDRLVAAGADVVAGHHPHVLQGIVPVGPSLIAYSLGNFVWYSQGPVSRLTGVLLVTLGDGGVVEWELVPAVIGPTGSPVPAGDGDRAAIAERLRRVSADPGPCPPEEDDVEDVDDSSTDD
jgi:hypothetical protein